MGTWPKPSKPHGRAVRRADPGGVAQQNEREAMFSSMEEGVLAIDNGGTISGLNGACATLLQRGAADCRGGASTKSPARPTCSSSSKRPGRPRAGRWRPADSRRGGALADAHGAGLQDPQRRKIGVLIVLHDITRLRRLEDVRRDFVANVSHELRTPITSIKGFLETLADGAWTTRRTPPLPADRAPAGQPARRHHRRSARALADREGLRRTIDRGRTGSRSGGDPPGGRRDVREEGGRQTGPDRAGLPRRPRRRDQRGPAGTGGGQPPRQCHQVQ